MNMQEAGWENESGEDRIGLRGVSCRSRKAGGCSAEAKAHKRPKPACLYRYGYGIRLGSQPPGIDKRCSFRAGGSVMNE